MITARILFDGTNGVSINSRTRIRDQETAPSAADHKRSMREKARRTFPLTAAVCEAHRQVPISKEDCHRLGCQVLPRAPVFVHTVGTFGVASAFCYWSRFASALGRLSQCVAGIHTWHMLVADDIERPFLGPLHKFLTRHPRASVRQVRACLPL